MAAASQTDVWSQVERLLAAADHAVAARWAWECASRAAGRFADGDGLDPRLVRALAHVETWLADGVTDDDGHHAAVIGAHNAARALPDRTGVRAAARAVAQAVATVRSPEHAIGAAMYAAMAARDTGAPASPPDVAAAAAERAVQRDRLAVLVGGPGCSVEPGADDDADGTSPQTARAPESPTR